MFQSELDYIKLEALTDETMVRRLTVRQCRVLLAKHRVTTTAIIEKEQLVDRVLTLWRSYKQNKQSELSHILFRKIVLVSGLVLERIDSSILVQVQAPHSNSLFIFSRKSLTRYGN